MGTRHILHCDMNCFYASVEMQRHPELRDTPLAVCGSQEERHGIVLTANYIAKPYGVKTGMAIWQAKQRCPQLVTLPPDMDEYIRISRYAREIYEDYTDQVEPFGLDENWLDVTGSVGLYGSPMTIAREISSRIKSELGITASIGVANNKITANWGATTKSRTPSPGSSRITTRRSSIPCRWKTCSMWGLPPPKSCGPLGSTPSAGWRSARKMCCSGALGKWGWSSVCSQRGGMSPLCRRRIIFQTSSPSATVPLRPGTWYRKAMCS